MSLEQLVASRPSLLNQPLKQTLRRSGKRATRNLLRSKRLVRQTIARQYYLTSAYADGRQAFLRNEDIVLGGLILSAVTAFAVVSLLANTIYTFVLAGSILSSLTGASLAAMSVLALAVVATLAGWLAAWFHNLLAISIADGWNRKHYRTLRSTLRKSLRQTSKVVSAWLVVLIVTFVPSVIICLMALAFQMIDHLVLAAALPYLIGAVIIATVWAATCLANFSLLPYVALFESPDTWVQGLHRAYRLTARKGRMFVLSNYVLTTVLLAAAYAGALGFQALTHISTTLTFMVLVGPVLATSNLALTMLYLKRKRAR